MSILWAILVATIAIAATALMVAYNKKQKTAFHNNLTLCRKNVPDALRQINELTAFQHRFSETEEKEFTQTYKELLETSESILVSKYIAKANVDVESIKDFVAAYKGIGALREQNNKLYDTLAMIANTNQLADAFTEYTSILTAQSYLTESRKNEFTDKYSSLKDVLELSFKHPELLDAILSIGKGFVTELQLHDFCNDLNRIDELKKEKNQEYVRRELEEKAPYFHSVLKYPLSSQQRNAIVLDEDNVLVISSAGSGKTFSMQGKVKYLVEQRHVSPSNILLVTFTRKAAESLKERINMEGVTCSTFDSLANTIVANATGQKPNVCDEKNISEYVFNQLLEDSNYLKAVTDYLLKGTINSEADVDDTQQLVEARKNADHRTLLPCMDGQVVFTKSEQERIIADILAANGVKYRYEQNYEYNVATLEHQQYKPDFSIYFTDKEKITLTDTNGNTHTETREVEKRIYLEHFGVGIGGQVPKWFAQAGESHQEATKRYTDGINWKRTLHREKGTVLLETSSADFQMFGNAEVEKRLLKMLADAGVPLNPLPPQTIARMINEANPQRLRSVKTMVTSFISLLKGSCKEMESIIIDIEAEIINYSPSWVDIVNKKEKKKQHNEFLQKQRDLTILEKIIRPYYLLYQKKLQEANQKDFTDIVVQATEHCLNNPTKRYDYILIDEFQDMSIVRYKFIQALRSDTPYKTKLFCVGDDWQSIYRFAGSDISLFNNFADYFGFVEECKIETTYRFGEPLASLSSDFILVNPLQKKKQVRCLESAHTDMTCHPYYYEKRPSKGIVTNVAKVVSQILYSIPQNQKVYFIGRYTFDVKTLELPEDGFRVSYRGEHFSVLHNGREYPFLTVHQAKGLEADCVILLNCNSGTYGFPSTIEDDPVLSYVLSESDQFRFAEERRLFYVAITRSSKHTYILYDGKKPSIFLEQFIKAEQPTYGFCPLCKQGQIVRHQQRTIWNGNIMIEYRCSNSRYGCNYKNIEWINQRPFRQ